MSQNKILPEISPDIDEAEQLKKNNKWNRNRRLEFIDFRLTIDGKLNRSDLVDFFGISVPQASLDISKYRQLLEESSNPRKNFIYDKHLKNYIRTDDFAPLFPNECSPEAYLNDLLLSAKGQLAQSRNYFGFEPSVGVAAFTPPRRNIKPEVLYNLLDAIRIHKAVHIVYKSLKADKPQDHLVAPHGLAFDGFRWHVRAYCYDRHGFRDYVISRVVGCDIPKIAAPNDRFPDPLGNGFREVGTSNRDDKEWNEIVELKLQANPELPENYRRAIELDYGMEKDGFISYQCKRALLHYAVRFLHLSDEYQSLPATERHLSLVNKDEIEGLLKESAELAEEFA